MVVVVGFTTYVGQLLDRNDFDLLVGRSKLLLDLLQTLGDELVLILLIGTDTSYEVGQTLAEKAIHCAITQRPADKQQTNKQQHNEEGGKVGSGSNPNPNPNPNPNFLNQNLLPFLPSSLAPSHTSCTWVATTTSMHDG
jgi:hypothetical protein